MRTARAALQHLLNPLHIYCRLRRAGIDSGKARRVCALYEKYLYRPALN